MPIPAFDHNGVIPPYNGKPTSARNISPYPVSMLEVCQRFAYSEDRKTLLRGLLNLRMALRNIGAVGGFQWIDGSFLEDIEHGTHRAANPPQDIDVVTFLKLGPSGYDLNHPIFPTLKSEALTKAAFKIDHRAINLADDSERLVEQAGFGSDYFHISEKQTSGREC